MGNKCPNFKEDNVNPTISLQSDVRTRLHVTSLYHVTCYLITSFYTIRAMTLIDFMASQSIFKQNKLWKKINRYTRKAKKCKMPHSSETCNMSYKLNLKCVFCFIACIVSIGSRCDPNNFIYVCLFLIE